MPFDSSFALFLALAVGTLAWATTRAVCLYFTQDRTESRRLTVAGSDVVREAIPFLLWLLAVCAPRVARWVDAESGLVVVPVAAVVLAVVAAAREQSRAGDARLLLLVLAAVGYSDWLAPAVGAVHDAALSGLLVEYPGNLRRLFLCVLAGFAGVALYALLSARWVWRAAGLGLAAILLAEYAWLFDSHGRVRLVLAKTVIGVLVAETWGARVVLRELVRRSLATWFVFDPMGRRRARLRHVAHAYFGSGTRWSRLQARTGEAARVVAGGVPPWLRRPSEPVPSYYAGYVEEYLTEAAERTYAGWLDWRAERLRRGESTKPGPAVRSWFTRYAQWVWAWEDVRACPVAGCPHGPTPERLGERITTVARLLLVDRELAPSRSSRLRARLRRRMTADLHALAAADPVAGVVKQLVLQQLDAGGGEEARAARRAELTRVTGARSVLGELAIALLLDDCRRARDWEGAVEVGRVIAEAGLRITPADHLELGEAYWQYGLELGSGWLGEWAREQAVGHFFQAGSAAHLHLAAEAGGQPP